jgi:subtilisin family serine protease
LYFPGVSNTVCPNDKVAEQASKLTSVGIDPLHYKGEGVLIIVWDFVPENAKALQTREFEGRAGGPVSFYQNESDAFATHGMQCCSQAAGYFAGIAPAAKLALVGLGNDPFADLALIEKLVSAFNGPCIVNMSFAFEWQDVFDDLLNGEKGLVALADALNKTMEEMKQRHKQLMFLVAAGNESVDMCDSSEPLTFADYNRLWAWPQMVRGRKTPFLQVGATDVSSGGVAAYSNYGSCVFGFAPGGNSCLVDGKGGFVSTRGTSFASPLVAGLAALYFSMNPRGLTASAVSDALAATTKQVKPPFPANTTRKLLAFDPSLVEAAAPSEEPPALPSADQVYDTSPSTKKETNLFTYFVTIGLLLLCFLVLFIYWRFSRQRR